MLGCGGRDIAVESAQGDTCVCGHVLDQHAMGSTRMACRFCRCGYFVRPPETVERGQDPTEAPVYPHRADRSREWRRTPDPRAERPIYLDEGEWRGTPDPRAEMDNSVPASLLCHVCAIYLDEGVISRDECLPVTVIHGGFTYCEHHRPKSNRLRPEDRELMRRSMAENGFPLPPDDGDF